MNRPLISLGMLLALGISAQANAQSSDQTAARVKQLKAEIKTFRLELLYNGEEGKPFYRLILSVPLVPARSNPFYRIAQITEAQAEKIIDHLATEEFLDKAEDLKMKRQRPVPNMPGYTLTVTTEERSFREDLGWGLPMLKRLDGLRKVLDGDAAKDMDFLLGRLSGLRKQWDSESVGKWKKLYEDQARYKNQYKNSKLPEQVFRGTLQRHQRPKSHTPHRYKLGNRFLYPPDKNEELERLIGRKVEIRGKPYETEFKMGPRGGPTLRGIVVREIWVAEIRAAGSATPKTATLAQALEDWIVLLEANDVGTAQKRWAKDAAATKNMKKWWANLGDCHKQYDYRKWLDRAKQIGDATHFKVGGHSFGYMHVDWEKTGHGWRIAKVWICR